MIGRPHQNEFEKFVRTSSGSLTRTAFLLCGDHAAAEDIVQVALVRTARRWRIARGNPVAYTRRVVVNLVHDRWRNLARRPAEVFVDVEVVVPADADDHRLERLASAVEQLSPEQRSAVVLRYIEGFSIEETAAALGCGTGAVKSRTHRGLAALRTLLDPTSSEHRAEPVEQTI
ncbi:SigE family RNA polymerase sigma factor [Nocardioides silvaticus]|uniref:SigE family RNA polymerase sigma factor n=1 Tax=Nocardioides silvaticus TaxID=2201891 RepID=A0A316THU7_9ACTN|nr:SigE family RNA polymerase sigma factor [Nocardioides silvaticus]PWN03091.1 SigE family RNA polymerase sigma factor [Nocardioides silvaticus]